MDPVQPFQKLIDDGGLTSSDFSGKQDNAFAVVDSIAERRQRLPDRWSLVKKARVGADAKWSDSQAKKAFVHTFLYASTFCCLGRDLFPEPDRALFLCRLPGGESVDTCVRTGSFK